MSNYIVILLFVFSLKANAEIILIDPGHGGQENGAIGENITLNNIS